MNIPTQSTKTINGVRFTASKIRRSPQSVANGGHNIATTAAGDIHWQDTDNGVVVINAGAVHTEQGFGSGVCILA